MTSPEKNILEFEGFRLDTAKRSLKDAKGETIKLMPKAFDILAFLAQNNDRVVSKDELLAEMWPDTVVEENNLTQNISALRRAFGERPQENRFISTIPGRGYRFVADVRHIEPETPAISEPDSSETRNRPPAAQARPSSFKRWWILAAAIPLIAIIAYYFFWPGQGVGNVRSLAVLPFRPISADTRDEALELGMADSLITKLAAGSELRVLLGALVLTCGVKDVLVGILMAGARAHHYHGAIAGIIELVK